MLTTCRAQTQTRNTNNQTPPFPRDKWSTQVTPYLLTWLDEKKRRKKKGGGGGPFLLCVSFLLELLCLWFSTRIISGSVVVGRARPTEHQTNKRNKNENISYPTACCKSRVVLSHRCGCGCSYRVPGSSDGLISNDNRVISNDLFGCCRTIIGFDTISITGTEFDTISTNDAGRLIEHQV